jgi:hypothetical protein
MACPGGSPAPLSPAPPPRTASGVRPGMPGSLPVYRSTETATGNSASLAPPTLERQRLKHPQLLTVLTATRDPTAHEPPLRPTTGDRQLRGYAADRRGGEFLIMATATPDSSTSPGVCQSVTANSRQSPGTPFRSCSPRSSKARSEPATRSTTVLETRTSPGPARLQTRWAM